MKKQKRRYPWWGIVLCLSLIGTLFCFTGCMMWKDHDPEESETVNSPLSIEEVVDFLDNSMQYEIDASACVPIENDDAAETQKIYETDVKVSYIDIVEIYKEELARNPNANDLSTEEIMKLFKDKSDEQLKSETIHTEVILSEGEWKLTDESAMDSIRDEQANDFLSYIINSLGTLEVDDLYEYNAKLQHERNE